MRIRFPSHLNGQCNARSLTNLFVFLSWLLLFSKAHPRETGAGRMHRKFCACSSILTIMTNGLGLVMRVWTSFSAWRWCSTGRFATTIFNPTHHFNIIATLFRMVATLFQHCYSVLRKNSSLRIVPCNIASTLTAWISISLFHLASRFTAFFVSSRNASCGEERCVTRDDYYLANLVRKKRPFICANGVLNAYLVY